MTLQEFPGDPSAMPERIGPYRIERTLGRGGMGIVYAAWDERLHRRVALKHLLPEVVGDRVRRERIRREAQTIARLDHAAIVQVYDLLERREGDWIVMQYVDGASLASRLRHGPQSIAEVLALAMDVASGLAAAHEEGLLHRDLKAENVLLTRTGAKILDFGLAKSIVTEETGLGAEWSASLTSGIVGTCRAMSPEQANGFQLDARTDLFSFGVLLYEAATGVSPFHDRTPVGTMTRVCTHRQTPAHEVEPTVPEDLSALIDALLEKDPARRPSSAAAVLDRLRALGAEGGASEATADELRCEPSFKPSAESETIAEPIQANGPSTISDSKTGVGKHSAVVRRLDRRRLLRSVVAALALGGLATAAFLFLLPSTLGEPLYVVVARPAIGDGADSADDGPERLTAAALDAALLRALASLEGIVALAADPSEGAAAVPRLAQVHAADEVLSSSLDCAASQCLVTLRRQRGADGRLVEVQTFEVPTHDVHLLSIAADTYLRAAFSGFTSRRGNRGLDVRTTDYDAFLALQRRWVEERPADLKPLFSGLAEIRSGSPRFVDAYLLEARLASQRFFDTRETIDLDRSFSLIEQARNLAPGDTEPLVVLFDLAVSAARLDRAEAAAAELERLSPGSVGVLRRRAVLAEARNDGRRALKLLQEAVDRRPSAGYLMDLARMQLRQSETDNARETLEGLLLRTPGYLGGERLLARIELQSGSAARAVELYADLLTRRRGFAELSNLGVAQMLLGDWQGATASLLEAQTLAPQSASAALNLADALNLAGRRREASDLYLRVLELVERDPAPNYWQTLSVKGQALAHLGRATAAAAAIQAATASAPSNSQLAYEAALVYALIGEPSSALASAERAVSAGFDRRWFALPFFDSVRATQGWEGILAATDE